MPFLTSFYRRVAHRLHLSPIHRTHASTHTRARVHTHHTQATGKDWGNALKQGYREDAGLFCTSDDDEQLIITIPFKQIVNLSSIAIAGPADGRVALTPREGGARARGGGGLWAFIMKGKAGGGGEGASHHTVVIFTHRLRHREGKYCDYNGRCNILPIVSEVLLDCGTSSLSQRRRLFNC